MSRVHLVNQKQDAEKEPRAESHIELSKPVSSDLFPLEGHTSQTSPKQHPSTRNQMVKHLCLRVGWGHNLTKPCSKHTRGEFTRGKGVRFRDVSCRVTGTLDCCHGDAAPVESWNVAGLKNIFIKVCTRSLCLSLLYISVQPCLHLSTLDIF